MQNKQNRRTKVSFPLLLLLLISTHVLSQDQDSDFSAKVRLVEVTVQALDQDGRHVLDLRSDEITVEANRQQRQVRLFEPVQIGLERFSSLKKLGAEYAPIPKTDLESLPPRYYLLLFHQIQFRFGSFQRAKAAAIEFIQNYMLPNDKVAVVGFDKRIDFEIDFTDDKATVVKAIEDMHLKFRNISMRDEFYTYLQNLSLKMAREPHKVTVILIAEGMQGIGGATSYAVYDRTIETLQAADIRIFGVDAGGLNLKDPGATIARFSPQIAAKINQSFNLGLYSEPTGGAFFRYHNDILALFQQVDYEMSAYYIVGFHLDEEDEKDTELSIDISTNRPGVTLRHKSRFKATTVRDYN